jgi:hypothetical protein
MYNYLPNQTTFYNQNNTAGAREAAGRKQYIFRH